MNDEKYVFFQDLKEKKVTGYSARKQRSHCGKGGRVKLPSDYLTKKELKNMSGECKSYRMNSPMKWQEFKAMPKDLQIAYIKAVKEKYNPPVSAMARMFGCDRTNLSRCLISLGFEKNDRGPKTWDKMGFAEWCFGMPKTEECQSVQEEVKEEISAEEAEEILDILGEKQEQETVEEVVSTSIVETPYDGFHILPEDVLNRLLEAVEEDKKKVCAIPESGSLTFSGNPVSILNTLGNLLSYRKVSLSVTWNVVEE